jgi:isopentenyl-diphosphate Delta-isomerase
VYKASDAQSGLTEHEFDHVLLGEFEGQPKPDPREVEGWLWSDQLELVADVEANPHRYTPWSRWSSVRFSTHLAAIPT